MNIVTAVQRYIEESVAEMRKVVWPSRKQTIQYSLVVIGLSIFMAIYFGLADYILNYLLEFLIA